MIVSSGDLTWPSASVGAPTDQSGTNPDDLVFAQACAVEWLTLQTAGIYGTRTVLDRPMTVFSRRCLADFPDYLRSIYSWGRGWPFDTDPRTGFMSSRQIIELETDAVLTDALAVTIFVGPDVDPDPAVADPVTGVVDPSAYRLEGNYLIRQDGWVWPSTQNMISALGQPDTWSITYDRGVVPPLLGQRAAQLLTNEILKAIAGNKACSLPFNATTITRAGVTINRDVIKAMKTSGVSEVDRWVAMVNPNGLQQAPIVWSPDVARHGEPYAGSYYGGAPS